MPEQPFQEGFPFTDEQRAILKHPPFEHGRVLAGPGTGKSTTAAALAQELMMRDPIPRVKFLTFTRAATAELSKLISTQTTEDIKSASTIHSFSVSAIVRNPGCAPFPHPLRISDKYEYEFLIKPHLAQKINVGKKKLVELVKEMSAKWASLVEMPNEGVSPEERARFLGVWMQHRHVFGYTLLDELPDLLRQALRDHDDLLGLDYDLLIVDEYQDLNACDLEVLHRLSQRGMKILAVGDDNQSIYYSLRKAHPAGIRNFPQEYEVKRQYDYQLTICQRSPRTIFNWAQHVIRGLPDFDPHRSPISFAETAHQGMCSLLSFPDDDNEARGVFDLIGWLHHHKNIPLSEILILYRTDTFGSPFVDRIYPALSDNGIELSLSSRIDDLLNDESNRKLLAILHLAVNQEDSLAWWTLIKLRPSLGDAFVNYLYNRAVRANTTFGAAFIREAQNGFVECQPSLRRQTEIASTLWRETFEILNQIMDEEVGTWGRWIIEKIDNGQLPECSQEFRELLLAIDDEAEDEEWDLGRFLSQIQPKGKDLFQSKSNGVRFMTMTGSKGLTARATIVVGVDNDLIPHRWGDVNEERRLLYVAMTRPKEFLFMTWVTMRTGQAAHLGRANFGRRQPTEFLRGGPVESEDGRGFIENLMVQQN
jgi:DNA helicase-2/ATP-dependent DNA helicase PcrA